MLSDWGSGGHQTDSLSGRLGFDLRYDDFSAGKIFGLSSSFSYEPEEKSVGALFYSIGLVFFKLN